jgi:ribosomal protein L32
MASLAVRLSETTSTWGRAVAPIAELGCTKLLERKSQASSRREDITNASNPAPEERRQGQGVHSRHHARPYPENICPGCGTTTRRGRLCPKCGREISKEKLIELAKAGRVAAQTPESRKKRSEAQRRHGAGKRAWLASPKPAWLNEDTYLKKIHPRLAGVTISTLSSTLGVSESYAADIRAGRHRPHPRHWEALAELVGMKQDS